MHETQVEEEEEEGETKTEAADTLFCFVFVFFCAFYFVFFFVLSRVVTAPLSASDETRKRSPPISVKKNWTENKIKPSERKPENERERERERERKEQRTFTNSVDVLFETFPRRFSSMRLEKAVLVSFLFVFKGENGKKEHEIRSFYHFIGLICVPHSFQQSPIFNQKRTYNNKNSNSKSLIGRWSNQSRSRTRQNRNKIIISLALFVCHIRLNHSQSSIKKNNLQQQEQRQQISDWSIWATNRDPELDKNQTILSFHWPYFCATFVWTILHLQSKTKLQQQEQRQQISDWSIWATNRDRELGKIETIEWKRCEEGNLAAGLREWETARRWTHPARVNDAVVDEEVVGRRRPRVALDIVVVVVVVVVACVEISLHALPPS